MFSTKEEFESYFNKNYKEPVYEDLKQKLKTFCQNNEIFESDYKESGKISKDDFLEHLNQTAAFTFQDLFAEAYYDKNPELYENAFTVYEMNEGKPSDITEIFHKQYYEVYGKIMNQLFDDMIGNSDRKNNKTIKE